MKNHILKSMSRSNNFFSVLSNGIGAIVGLLSFILLTRTLEKTEFGAWVIYISAATFLDILRNGLVHTALVRFYSGAETDEKKIIVGSSWLIALGVTAVLWIFVVTVSFIFADSIQTSSFDLFFRWYPIYALASLPYGLAAWLLHAKQNFDRLLILRVLFRAGFLLFLLFNAGFLHWGVESIILGHIGVNLLMSIFSLLKGWTEFNTIFQAERKKVMELLHFGKYCIGTLLGSNLLKSSDIFIIGWLLGPVAVAVYSVPLKLIEIIETPLRGFTATALPEMSKRSINNQMKSFCDYFIKYSALLTVLLLPIIAGCFVFADKLVLLVGGENYRNSAILLQIFCVYSIFLPLDRYLGMALDSINKPQYNFLKMIIMVVVNVGGNFLAIRVWGELWAVAMVTISTFIIGVLAGLILLRKNLRIDLSSAVVNILNVKSLFYYQSYLEKDSSLND